MKNYNTLLRKTIVNDIETIITKKFKSLHEAVMIYQQSLYPLIDNNKPESKVVMSCLMGLVYADSYKYFSYKQKNMNNKPTEIETFHDICVLEDGLDLITEISANPDLFCRMLEATYYYNETSGLAKVLMMKSLSEEEHQKILNMTGLHSVDKETYDKEITLTDIMKNMKSQRSYQHKVMTLSFDEGIITEVLGFIINISKYDNDNAIKLILEIAENDYEISKYLYSLFSEETTKKHIETYEVLTKDQIINILKNNQSFLYESINNIYEMYVSKTHNNKDLNEEQLEEFKDEGITKKLTVI